MLKVELKYRDEEELLRHIASLKQVVKIIRMSRPEHNKVWSKIYLDVENKI